jgi:hypothetical protein
MLRTGIGLVAMLLVAGTLHTASAQTAAPATAKPGHEGQVERQQAQIRRLPQRGEAKGLAGDDRWFYIEDCMGKS